MWWRCWRGWLCHTSDNRGRHCWTFYCCSTSYTWMLSSTWCTMLTLKRLLYEIYLWQCVQHHAATAVGGDAEDDGCGRAPSPPGSLTTWRIDQSLFNCGSVKSVVVKSRTGVGDRRRGQSIFLCTLLPFRTTLGLAICGVCWHTNSYSDIVSKLIFFQMCKLANNMCRISSTRSTFYKIGMLYQKL